MAPQEAEPFVFSSYWAAEGTKVMCIIVWVVAQIITFSITAQKYRDNTLAFGALGWGVVFARAFASAIKLNCALVLFPVMRNFLTYLRGSFVNNIIPIDKNIVFHKGIAWAIFAQAWAHMLCHFVNYKNMSKAPAEALNEVLGREVFLETPTTGALAFTTLPGWTGHVVMFCMYLMYASAMKNVRRPFFELFWYMHHLFIIFFALLCLHGTAALLEAPEFWKYFALPGFLYFLERIRRMMKSSKIANIQMVVFHPSKVVEIRMDNPFEYNAGMYCFLNSPLIYPHEWHPFTISSSPDESFLSVHIRVVGDWTGELAELLHPNSLAKLQTVQENQSSHLPLLTVDGPFGTAAAEVFHYNTVVLVGAGIGVTPYASILKDIRYKLETGQASKLQKVYFIWMNRDAEAFEWFRDLLAELEERNQDNVLEIMMYFTGVKNMDMADLRALAYNDSTGTAGNSKDLITGLESRTNFGRPNFDQLFKDWQSKHRGDRIAVFFCGPAIIGKKLRYLVHKYTDATTNTRFDFHKENF